jgi:hypothetical protein
MRMDRLESTDVRPGAFERLLHGLTGHATVVMLVGLLVGMAPGSAAGQARDRSTPAGFEDYQVVVDQNMFLRERGRRPEPPPQEREPEERPPEPEPQRPEQWYVLRGLVFEGEEPLAFFENTQQGVTRAYRAGDPLLNGRIESISLMGVEYVADEQRVQVGLGRDLDGERSTAVAGAGTGSAAPSNGTATGGSELPAGGDLLERMRRRSAMERGGR